jgi:hypothetical protein
MTHLHHLRNPFRQLELQRQGSFHRCTLLPSFASIPHIRATINTSKYLINSLQCLPTTQPKRPRRARNLTEPLMPRIQFIKMASLATKPLGFLPPINHAKRHHPPTSRRMYTRRGLQELALTKAATSTLCISTIVAAIPERSKFKWSLEQREKRWHATSAPSSSSFSL